MAMMISSLPRDLLEEILSRVPLNFIKTVRSTCKTWNDLSKSESFAKIHIAKSAAATREGESMMIAIMNYKLYFLSVVVDHVDPSIDVKGKLSCLEEQVKIVFHCEGLLLCIFKDDSRFRVWNPYLGQKRWIEPRYSHRLNGWDRFNYALGYEDTNSCRSFKLLRFIDYWYKATKNQFLWYEIYDFDSGLWTTLDVTPHWCIAFGNLGVSLKGNTYWCAKQRNLEVFVDRIISFDFTKERFGPFIPLPCSAGHGDYVTLSCVREEKLAVLLQHGEGNPYELDIWISTKIDEAQEVSWIKFLRVETEFDIVPFLSGGFFIDEEKKVAIGFDLDKRHTVNIIGEAGYLRQLEILPESAYPDCTPHMCTYVPSFVEIKQLAGGKQQSDLEKRRFDENMLRLAAFEANMN